MDSNLPPKPLSSGSYARIPLDWIKTAGINGFRDMRLAAYLWFEHGVNRGRQFPASPHKALKLTGISQSQFQKGIRQLNRANLIQATPRAGSKTLVRMKARAVEAGRKSEQAVLQICPPQKLIAPTNRTITNHE